ncbi:MAG: hypothetical protein V5A18_09250 [Haloarculaceae archaeon]
MVDKYDAYLGAIAGLVVAGGLASFHPALAVYQGVGLGSLVATLVLFDALFRNPPTEATRSTASPSAIVMVGWLATLLTYL